MTNTDDPKPKSYAPFVVARHPLNRARDELVKPPWRIIVHRKHVKKWNQIPDRCGESNAGELWLHLATQPDQPPKLGTVTPMKGGQYAGDGTWSRVFHYELSGAARIDYQYAAELVAAKGDKHAVVRIVSIEFGSH